MLLVEQHQQQETTIMVRSKEHESLAGDIRSIVLVAVAVAVADAKKD